jgi:predicted transcriptional regulator
METLNIWDSDYRFMVVVWEHAPVGSGELVKLCRDSLGWKKSTTYNAIRRMSEKGLIRNDNAMVSVIVHKEQVQMMESDAFLSRTFDGSLPQFLTAFLNGRALSDEEANEIKRLIDAHKEKQL